MLKKIKFFHKSLEISIFTMNSIRMWLYYIFNRNINLDDQENHVIKLVLSISCYGSIFT